MDIIETALRSLSRTIPKGPIAVGMSGGVDSSVTAALLQKLGYEVIGLFMKNWEEVGETSCPASIDAEDVAGVAKLLQIPFYTVNFTKEYWDQVFESFLADLKNGRTPNPDILCNREIKFKLLLERALALPVAALATGHYAGIGHEEGLYTLEKAFDLSKDQSYFLYTATQHSLAHSLFPLATLTKLQVRHIARLLKLPVSEKKDSTGICFIGERKFKEFLAPHLGYSPGTIITVEGKVVGQHIGLAYYTIGQRKGLLIGGQGEAWYVAGKNILRNELIVVQGERHPALFASRLIANNVHWISQKEPSFPLRCMAKIRYRQEDQSCTVTATGPQQVDVLFDTPQRAITPQQSVVFYQGNRCLGGGFIA